MTDLQEFLRKNGVKKFTTKIDRKKSLKPRSWIEMGRDIDGRLTYIKVTDFGLIKSSKVRKIKCDKNSFKDIDSCKSRPEFTRKLLLKSCDEVTQNEQIGIGIVVRSGIEIDVRSGIEVGSPPELKGTLQENYEPTLDDESLNYEDLPRLTKTSIELANQLGLPGINFTKTNPFAVKDTGAAGRSTNGWKSDRLNQLIVGTDSRIGQPTQTGDGLTNGGLDKKIGGLAWGESADSNQSKNKHSL